MASTLRGLSSRGPTELVSGGRLLDEVDAVDAADDVE